jgi:hypothetical protein
LETGPPEKPANGGLSCRIGNPFSDVGTGWLGRQDSNLKMVNWNPARPATIKFRPIE